MKKETIWQEIDRYIKTISDEIRTAKPDRVTVDFYLFKIERRIAILKDYIKETEIKNVLKPKKNV
jgi:DNA primase